MQVAASWQLGLGVKQQVVHSRYLLGGGPVPGALAAGKRGPKLGHSLGLPWTLTTFQALCA